jgi:hypothetical protein
MNSKWLVIGGAATALALVWGLSGGSGSSGSGGLGGASIVDRRQYAQLTEDAAQHVRQRDPSGVYALVLHQMGFSRGNDPGKYDRVTAHYVILPDGGTYWLHDHATVLPASSGFNSGSVSVEFAGNFPSVAGSTDPKHFWSSSTHGMDQLTPDQITAGRALVNALRGQGLTHILAHRQSGPQRQNDPGPDVWREVGAWAVKEHGLSWGGEGFSVSGGSPIPQAWWGPSGAPAVA